MRVELGDLEIAIFQLRLDDRLVGHGRLAHPLQPHLAHLELGVMPWANGVVKLGNALRFERLTSLRSVHFQYGLGPVRTLSFAGCAALRSITSEPTLKITFLNLCGTSVGATCIEALMPKLPELGYLLLRKCAALDGRLAISSHKTLQHVELTGCASLRHLHLSLIHI